MATYEDLQAAVDAIHQAHPEWGPGTSQSATSSIWDFLDTSLKLPHQLQQEAPNELFDFLRRIAPPGAFTSSGQLVNAPTGAPNLPSPGAANPPPANIPGPPPGAPVNRALVTPPVDMAGLNGQGTKFKTGKAVPHDPIPTFLDGYKAVQDVTEHGPSNSGWNSTIKAIRGRMENALKLLDAGIEGRFADALRGNLQRSFAVLDELSNHAQTMEILVDTFFNDLATTKSNFAQNWELCRQAMQDPTDPTNRDTLNQLNALVGPIMAQYRPPIDTIAARHPGIDSALPHVGTPGPAAPGPGVGGPGGSGGGGPIALPRGARNTGDPLTPAIPEGAAPNQAKASSMPSIPTDAGGGAADAAKQAGDQAQKAAGQAAGAGQQALNSLTGAQQHPGLPAGALGLGPTGLAKPGSGAGGRGGGGTGGGAGGRHATVGRPAAAQPVTPAKVASSGAPASRAGISGTGSPGAAGAPAAGHRGTSADKTHKVSKALSSAKNGEELLGETEAFTSVIGDSPRKSAPAADS